MKRRTYLATASSAISGIGLAGCSLVDGLRSGTATSRSCPVDPQVNPGTSSWPTVTGDARNTRSIQRGAAPDPPLSIKWQAVFPEHRVAGDPVVADGVVYTVTHPLSETPNEYELRAIDAESGQPTWTRPVTGYGPPVVGSDDILVSGTVQVFETSGTGPRYVDLRASVNEGMRATVVERTVLHPTWEGLYAYDISTGERQWSAQTNVRFTTNPAVSDETVYAAAYDGIVRAFDLETGDMLWDSNVGEFVRVAPTILNGTVYVAPADLTVHALDAATGDRRWKRDLEDTPAMLGVDGGNLYVGCGETLFALRADTGERCWQFDDFRGIGGLAVGPDHVFATSTPTERGLDGVASLDPSTGDVEWRFSSEELDLSSGPAVVDGDLYLGGRRVGEEFDAVMCRFS